jgi:hypothetical protein
VKLFSFFCYVYAFRPGNNRILIVYLSVQSKYKALDQCADLTSSVCTIIDFGLSISPYRDINRRYPDRTVTIFNKKIISSKVI